MTCNIKLKTIELISTFTTCIKPEKRYNFCLTLLSTIRCNKHAQRASKFVRVKQNASNLPSNLFVHQILQLIQ